jgi:uncharacterized protein
MREPVLHDWIGRVRARFRLDWTGIHGAPHWARVRRHGLDLAERTGANPRVVELFAFLHDVERHDDHRDPAHGARAAALVTDELRAFVRLSDDEAALLALACRHHSDGRLEADVTVQTCWDADRLDLGRVGIRPQPDRLCTPAARRAAVIERAWRWSRGGRA